jgi:hypothetical protein
VRHLLPLLTGLLGLLLAAGLGAAALNAWPDRPTEYSVTQVEAQLASHPRAWTDRTLLLRGVVVATGCFAQTADKAASCVPQRMTLDDADPTASGAPLPLALAGPNPLLTIVRRIPLLGSFVPASQVVHWDVAATYRVQLRATVEALCGGPPCYEALLLEAVQGPLAATPQTPSWR